MATMTAATAGSGTMNAATSGSGTMTAALQDGLLAPSLSLKPSLALLPRTPRTMVAA